MYSKLGKRCFDIIAALIALISLIPFLLLICILLVFTGEHEVFYFQERLGYKKSKFLIWKFATMLKDSPNLGTGSITLRNDPRVTLIGRFLRKTKINELPQLVNVLIGNMSIVGPRPQMDIDFIKFPVHIRKVINNVKPGLSGIGSIIFRDEEQLLSSAEGDKHLYYKRYIAPYKGEVELWYQKHLSFYTDLMLIFLTAWVILFPKSELVFSIFKDLPKRPEIFEIK